MSTSIPTVNIWWAHTMKPRNPIDSMAQTIPMYPNGSFSCIVCYYVGNYSETWEDEDVNFGVTEESE